MKQPAQVVLVEYALPAEAEVPPMRARLNRCLALRDARWLRSFVTADGRRALCVFEAPDAESVREAYRTAGVPFDRAWVASELQRDAPGDDPTAEAEGEDAQRA